MTTAYRVLLVEDEEHLLEAIRLNLSMEGYVVVTATDGKEAIRIFKQERFDLVILDVMLPELDGFRVCEMIRLENKSIPVLFLTAKDAAEDKVLGLRKGADDYLTKPFNLEEFLLRVQNLVKRGISGEKMTIPEILHFGGNKINFSTYEVSSFNGVQYQLTKKEMLLLKFLIERKGQVVSREQILESVWGFDVFPSTRTIDNFILSFRKYFESNPRDPKHFHSVRGIGYRFTA